MLPAHVSEPLLEARGVSRSFTIRDGLFHRRDLRAVDRVNLEIIQGETLGLVGESGCGKSTLARLLLGLLQPSAGEVRYMGGALSRQGMALRRDLQVIFQDPYSSLNPSMTAGEIVERPLIVHGLGTRAERQRRVSELFNWVGLPAESASRYAHEFSGGQRQRIAVARAIASGPRVVIADEPTSALDVSVQAKVLNLLKDLQSALGLTYVFISHDMRVVRHMCDRLAVMYLGRVVEYGPTEDVFTTPRHPYTRALLGAVPRMEPRRGRERKRVGLEGEPPSPLSPPPGCHFHPRCPWAVDHCREASPELRSLAPSHEAACHLALPLPLGEGRGEGPLLR
ncbi:MAG: ATP-binding cassette domain-containing protein [Chloroflexi bacterium]|nr:ATP-binding cassette domain-containing protein [Chloroflexota bacterium]MBV9599286.1 ATP-binding cassette domain-containing protein [Chloroflexota bacterium]